jgi:hypothetical protein
MTATSRKTLSFPQRTPNLPLTPFRIRSLKRPPALRPADQKLVERVRREFSAMRGLSPTLPQARRLFHLGEQECDGIFAQLLHEGFLDLCADERYRLKSHLRQADFQRYGSSALRFVDRNM